jgi:NADH:ubiquinone oxidoreductase subunit F (NADH-binding)
MTLVHRVLPPHPILTLDDYVVARGGAGLQAARMMAPDEIRASVTSSGLRGRGGGGFPTGRKWRTVVDNRSASQPPTVVVNGAEGEPGTFKDRTILRLDPYRVLEGALIAAVAVGADEVVVALKQTFTIEIERVRAAIGELDSAGWTDGVKVSVFEGPSEYLYGEETALLEALDGRMPFPRIAPPYRRGVDEVVETPADLRTGSGLSAHVELAGPVSGDVAPPTLVNNVETLANVPNIISRGPAWFRTEGTDESPGTIVCTVTGSTQRHGVGEVIMGTPLREVISLIGGGPRDGRRIVAVLSGVANALITEDQLDAPVSYEGLAATGSGLGSAGFIVFDDSIDPAAVAAGVSRFLAVESCGQCTPCKQDGLALSDELARLCRSDVDSSLPGAIRSRVGTVADEARCYLATQHQVVVNSLLERFPRSVDTHAAGSAPPVEPLLVSELVDIVDGQAVWDERHLDKQPDWTYGPEWSGATPVDLAVDHRAHRTG